MLADKLQPFLDRYDELSRLLSDPSITNDIANMTKLSKEQSNLEDIASAAKSYLQTLADIEENKALLDDAELGELAKDELKNLESQKENLEEEIKILLLPKDPNDDKNVFLEIRAGTGGDEAALFAGDLFNAYARYAELRGYKFEIVSQSEGNTGGFKEIILLIKGKGAYSRLKFEGGTHRVQRVPETESQGRVHTSAVTVAIMPEVEDSEIEINPNDLRIDVMRSSGHGGQSVNTTYSAIRLVHIPTGITVQCQDEKSQLKNKAKALVELRTRIYNMEYQKYIDSIASKRKTMVSTGDRSAKIRTYNYPQGRITDHRINYTIYNLPSFMGGDIQECIDQLTIAENAERLKENEL